MRNEIDKFTEIISRRRIVFIAVCVVGFVLTPFIALLIPAYSSTAELLIVSEALKDPTLSDPNLPAIVTSTVVMNRTISQLHLPMDAVHLAKKIKTKLPGKSSILDITYKDTDGVRAALVVNTVADQAVRYYHEIETQGSEDVIKTFQSQIAVIQKNLALAENAVRKASSVDAVGGADNALSDLTVQFDTLRAQRNSAASALAADEAQANSLDLALHRMDPIARGEILQKDVVYQQVSGQYARDFAELDSEKATFKDSFPGLMALARRTDREREQMHVAERGAVENGAGLSISYTQAVMDLDHANSVVSADRAKLATLNEQLATEQHHIQGIAGAGNIVSNLRSRRDAVLAQFMSLNARLSTAEGDAAQAASLGTLVVVSRAEVGSSSLMLYIMALCLATVALAIGAAYIAESLNPQFSDELDVQRVFNRPVLADIAE